jgi:hypothetical protein
MDADASIGESDPFAGDINFGVFVDDTGGKLFFNRNDVDAEMRQSQQLGSEYYTLTYQPHEVGDDGKFRRIRVTLRNPDLHVVTKAVYYAPDKTVPANHRETTMSDLAEAVRSSVPFQGVQMNVTELMRHPDAQTTEFTVQVSGKNLDWQASSDGKEQAILTLAVARLSGNDDILASKIQRWRFSTAAAQIAVTVRVPRRTKVIRVAIAGQGAGRIGTAEVGRKALDAAPATPAPNPPLPSPHPASTSPAPSGL